MPFFYNNIIIIKKGRQRGYREEGNFTSKLVVIGVILSIDVIDSSCILKCTLKFSCALTSIKIGSNSKLYNNNILSLSEFLELNPGPVLPPCD